MGKVRRSGRIESFNIYRNGEKSAADSAGRRGRHTAELAFLLAVLFFACLLLRIGCTRYMRAAYPLKYQEYVTSYAKQYDFDPALIYALIRTESGFNPHAVSSADAVGLMQLTKDTYDWAQTKLPESERLPEEDLYDPETNIRYGVLVLSMLRDQFSDTNTMLAAYNAGIGNVRRWLRNPDYSDDGKTLKTIPFNETRKYVDKIPAAQRVYEELYTF